MSNLKKAKREAFSEVSETCPHVDAALAAAADAIKEQTNSLREALIEALERALDAEERIAELEKENEELREELDGALSAVALAA